MIGSTRRRVKLVLAYDGTDYHGWQIQANGPSIQSALADAIEKTTGHRAIPIGSGRTDSGVHAMAQVAHFDTDSRLPVNTLLQALNHYLSAGIVVHSAEDVPPTFHARKDALWKLYRYVLQDGPVRNVFLSRYSWRVRGLLDLDAMRQAAVAVVGTHDFRCFETDWPNRRSSVRTVRRCEVSRLGEFLSIDVESDGFLYNMVRAIAGTLCDVGRGKRNAAEMRRIIEMGDRSLAGPTAPAQGLFLVRVEYPLQTSDGRACMV